MPKAAVFHKERPRLGGASASAARTLQEAGRRREEPLAPVAGNLIIVSAGKYGREVFGWAAQAIAAGAPYRIKGFLDSRADALDGYDYEAKILGDPRAYEIQEGDVFIGAMGDTKAKVEYCAPIIEKGGRFANLIHPTAIIGKNVRLGEGVVIAPFAALSADAEIGDHVSIGPFTNVGHDAVLGKWCQIGSHCGINGCVVLGDGVFLGSHACVIPDVTVGAWAFVGAGSVVIKDVAPQTKVFGSPARPIGKVDGPPEYRGQAPASLEAFGSQQAFGPRGGRPGLREA